MSEQVSKSNPYLDGRREWNERYGDYIDQANTWRMVSIVALVTAFVAVFGAVCIGFQHKTVPYVVEVDRSGSAIAVNQADQADHGSPRIIKALLAKWITDFRTIMVDATAQKQTIDRVYSFLAQGDASTTTVSEYFQTHGNPFDRAKKEIVSVEISSVLPISEKSWQIEWVETVRNRQGATQGKPQRMKAVASIVVVPPDNENKILKNPIGLYIKEISWTKQL